MPLSSRKASILGNADGSGRVQLSSSSCLPHHFRKPHSPGHGWVRNLCPLFSFLIAHDIKRLHHDYNQHHPFLSPEHLNCPDNSCKCDPEYVWSVFRKRSSNQPDPGSIAGHEPKSEEAPSSSPPTKHWLSHRWKNRLSHLGKKL